MNTITQEQIDKLISRDGINETTFEKIYHNYWKNVFGIVFHYTRDEEIAEEISQDLFAAIWEKRDHLIIKTSIWQYLSRAAKLEAFEYLRTSINHREHIDCAVRNICQSHNCTEEQVLFNELTANISNLVEMLPCRCRQVYRMSQEQGFSNKEIAAGLMISEKTVEYHLHKAFSFLRSSLQQPLN